MSKTLLPPTWTKESYVRNVPTKGMYSLYQPGDIFKKSKALNLNIMMTLKSKICISIVIVCNWRLTQASWITQVSTIQGNSWLPFVIVAEGEYKAAETRDDKYKWSKAKFDTNPSAPHLCSHTKVICRGRQKFVRETQFKVRQELLWLQKCSEIIVCWPDFKIAEDMKLCTCGFFAIAQRSRLGLGISAP